MPELKRIYCKYCGARLRRDSVGQYCPTPNCQWQHGLPEGEDTPTPKCTGEELRQWLGETNA